MSFLPQNFSYFFTLPLLLYHLQVKMYHSQHYLHCMSSPPFPDFKPQILYNFYAIKLEGETRGSSVPWVLGWGMPFCVTWSGAWWRPRTTTLQLPLSVSMCMQRHFLRLSKYINISRKCKGQWRIINMRASVSLTANLSLKENTFWN